MKNVLYLILIIWLLFINCALDPLAGGSTDTELGGTIVGIILNENGDPAYNAQVKLIPSNYNPVIDQPVPDSLIDTTDSSGFYSFTFTDTGTYNIQAVHLSQGTKVLITGVVVHGDTTVAPYGILKETGTIKTFLPDTIDTVNGYLYIEGTTLSKSLSVAVADSEGVYVVVDSVPESRINSIRYGILNDSSAPVPLTDTIDVFSSQITETDGFVFWANYSKENTPLPGNTVNDISRSPTTFVFATSGGVAVLGPTNYWTIHTADDIGVTSDNILSVCYIQYGIMWVATSGGAAELDGSNWVSYTTDNSGIPTNLTSDVAIDGIGYGDIWLSTLDKGLLMFNDTVWTVYDTSNSNIPSNGVLSVFVDRGDTVWCTTQNGVFKLKGSYSKALTSLNSGIPSGDIFCMAIDKNHYKWFGYNGGVARYNETDSIWTQYTSLHSTVFTDSVLTIAEDEDGSMLFGTPEGMSRFDGTKWFDYTGSRYQLLANSSVRSIAIDNDGNKWIGTADNGVIIFGPTVK